MAVLSLDSIVNIIVNLSPRSVIRKAYNLGLIVGKSPVIPLEERVRIYTNLDAIYEDGFTENTSEYKAASLYFSQKKKPKQLLIGRCDTGETAVQAVRACRGINREWYAVHFCDATDEDILTVAEYVETATPATVQFYTTSNGLEDDNVFTQLKALKRQRSLGQHSAIANATVGIMGWAMGANTGLYNSSYTLAYKSVAGITTEDVTEDELSKIKKANGNIYINRGADYDLFEQGVMADGTSFDEIINLDMLVNNVQYNIIDLLATANKVPQTETGVAQIKAAIKPALENALKIGFISTGVWKGPEIYNLKTGDTLISGYMIQSETVASQSQAERDARIAPPIYIAIKLAGAIEFVTVQIDVNR